MLQRSPQTETGSQTVNCSQIKGARDDPANHYMLRLELNLRTPEAMQVLGSVERRPAIAMCCAQRDAGICRQVVPASKQSLVRPCRSRSRAENRLDGPWPRRALARDPCPSCVMKDTELENS